VKPRAIVEVGVLRGTTDEYFPLGVVVHKIGMVVIYGKYNLEQSIKSSEFHFEEKTGQHTLALGEKPKRRVSS
jgi:hypothetical protein